jgi:hypothetical protein
MEFMNGFHGGDKLADGRAVTTSNTGGNVTGYGVDRSCDGRMVPSMNKSTGESGNDVRALLDDEVSARIL